MHRTIVYSIDKVQRYRLSAYRMGRCSSFAKKYNQVCFLQYLTNASLARTTVASATLMSSTSGLFTLFIGACLGQESIDIVKVIAVVVSMAGVAMKTLGKVSAPDESQLSTPAYASFPWF